VLQTDQALFSNPGLSQRLVFAMSGDAKGSLTFDLGQSDEMPRMATGDPINLVSGLCSEIYMLPALIHRHIIFRFGWLIARTILGESATTEMAEHRFEEN
jgi:hypothetical protein